jgi:hypothetical protein
VSALPLESPASEPGPLWLTYRADVGSPLAADRALRTVVLDLRAAADGDPDFARWSFRRPPGHPGRLRLQFAGGATVLAGLRRELDGAFSGASSSRIDAHMGEARVLGLRAGLEAQLWLALGQASSDLALQLIAARLEPPERRSLVEAVVAQRQRRVHGTRSSRPAMSRATEGAVVAFEVVLDTTLTLLTALDPDVGRLAERACIDGLYERLAVRGS